MGKQQGETRRTVGKQFKQGENTAVRGRSDTRGRKKYQEASVVREGERKTDPLLHKLRDLAVGQQQSNPQVFLSLRQAAQRFHVPLSSVATVYRQLREERILSTVRGSRTLLAPRGQQRKVDVRGVISIPLSLPRVQTLRDYRFCFLRTREELCARGFSVLPAYFEEREIAAETVAERARRDKVDAVFWIMPDKASRDIELRLGDAAIGFVGLAIAGASAAFCRYEVRRQNAVLQILDNWKADGKLSAALIVVTGHETAVDRERLNRLCGVIQLENMTSEIVTVPEGRISRFLKCRAAKDVGLLLPATATAMLAARAADTINEVLAISRIALIDGPLAPMFADRPSDSLIDTVVVDWSHIGKRIAQDILTGRAFAESERTVFEGVARLRVPLSSFTRALP